MFDGRSERRPDNSEYRRDNERRPREYERYDDRPRDSYPRDDYRSERPRDDYRRSEPRDDYRRDEPRRDEPRRDYFEPRRDDYRQDDYRPRNDYRREESRFDRPRDDYRREDRFARRPPIIQGERPPQFKNFERTQLKEFFEQTPNDWNTIASKLQRDAEDCRKQWQMWESQPDWTEDEADRLCQLFNSGKTIPQLAQEFQGRSEIGITAKLGVLDRRGRLNPGAPQNSMPQQSSNPPVVRGNSVADKIVDDAKKLVNKAKSEQLDQCKELLSGILAVIEEYKKSAK
ncbi:Conserved_hypothetical protein [Hexamita inflata]|uniref:Myb-like domain-containing protein n=1 Tax=Hexamita inflata TaxID=28002 RepID=A0AA86U2I9_9EUKA|nr:Conserved hypothetical protein [Hexamita inflata]